MFELRNVFHFMQVLVNKSMPVITRDPLESGGPGGDSQRQVCLQFLLQMHKSNCLVLGVNFFSILFILLNKVLLVAS